MFGCRSRAQTRRCTTCPTTVRARACPSKGSSTATPATSNSGTTSSNSNNSRATTRRRWPTVRVFSCCFWEFIVTLLFLVIAVNRFERPQINQSKQALSNLLRSRHPINQFMGPGGQNPQGPGPQAANYGQMRQFPRQPIRQQHPGAMQQNQVNRWMRREKTCFIAFGKQVTLST